MSTWIAVGECGSNSYDPSIPKPQSPQTCPSNDLYITRARRRSHRMTPQRPPGPPTTLGNMRELSVQHLIAYCLNDALTWGFNWRERPMMPTKLRFDSDCRQYHVIATNSARPLGPANNKQHIRKQSVDMGTCVGR